MDTLTKVKQVRLYNGDCLELMKEIPDESIDMILCDLPYETLNRANRGALWDRRIPLDRLWEIKFNEGVGGSDGSKGNGGIIAGGIGAALIVAAVVVFFTLPEKKRLAILGIKRPYIIPVDDIDEEDMKDYNLLYKKNRR